jgi:hypothetical protein
MRRLLRWELVSALIALLALGVPLAFSAREAQQAREAAELSLLTGLHELVNESQGNVDWNELRSMVEGDSYENLSGEDRARLTKALNNMEYLSWMFNKRFINLPAANDLWLDPMRCFRDAALAVWGEANARAGLPELIRYTERAKPCLEAGASAN